MKYKFRAECEQDVKNFISFIPNHLVSYYDICVEQLICPDVEGIIDIDMKLSDLRFLINQIPDCHVIAQTINYINKYTGERNYNI